MKLVRNADEFETKMQSRGVLASNSPIMSILSGRCSGTHSITSHASLTAGVMSGEEKGWICPTGREINGKVV